jgi:hypothetical protein
VVFVDFGSFSFGARAGGGGGGDVLFVLVFE